MVFLMSFGGYDPVLIMVSSAKDFNFKTVEKSNFTEGHESDWVRGNQLCIAQCSNSALFCWTNLE